MWVTLSSPAASMLTCEVGTGFGEGSDEGREEGMHKGRREQHGVRSGDGDGGKGAGWARAWSADPSVRTVSWMRVGGRGQGKGGGIR